MASEENSGESGAAQDPMSPAKRKRLQQCFEHGSKQASQDNYDYATELFTQCVIGDPANLIYLQSFTGNLQKKYGNNKKGSKLARFKGAGARTSLKKCSMQKDWEGVFRNGLEVLKLNPWDVSALMALATAAEETMCDECQLFYLKSALDTNSKDPDVNRACAAALRERKLFDQAIACWHRIEQVKPGNEEAAKAIADLAVEKTIAQGGYEEAESSTEVVANKEGQQVRREITPEEKLTREIARDPDNLDNYVELGQVHIRAEDYAKAEEVFAKAFEVSEGNPDIRERWEDAQLRNLRQKLSLSKAKTEQDGSDEAKGEYEELKKEFNKKELEVYRNRCERYPNNLAFKYDLGIRYQVVGMFNEAIKEFQLAKNDPRRKGVCLLRLGQCFQQIKQFPLAIRHYSSSITEIPDRDAENKKTALYLAGKLAMALKDHDSAERHLTMLAGLDFAYRDVSALLDKIAELRDNM